MKKDKNGIKWIEDLEAATPLVDAACRVLSIRFQAIAHALPRAVDNSDGDVEHVHHLRVGTRRARAAVDTFADCLRRKARKSAHKWLRTVRRAAGDARDWDVFMLTLRELDPKPNAQQTPGLRFVAGYAWARRQQAQDGLTGLTHRGSIAPEKIEERVLSAARRPKNRSLRELRDLALPRLSDALERLQTAASEVTTDYEQLHQVRIAGKRLRYAMEIFGSCFPAPFRDELYPSVEEMQDILGHANDSHVALRRLEAITTELELSRMPDRRKLNAGINAIVRFHQRRLRHERREFEAWYADWQTGGNDTQFLDLLQSM